ncbi:uncharacterized protein BBA_05396 [Beauveria bassiana ARSEF 2860]|uniref:Uncharacterized protein n=1 Tax=Beauveria bassiana (strain ARSEF 2860) TaxID=655819 RepID=J4ULP2_BEAB2|nr:uncharacterized protein BBA_05396 [Beauveria bassiana ARSEF 2860]EJP65527.1 hypothetical protein BBA_05396 [Beauveria bassiana ARSEF 2860]
MSQNNSNDGSNDDAVGGRLFSRQTQRGRRLDFATALGLGGPNTEGHVNRRPVAVSQNEDIASSRASGPNIGAAAAAARDALVQSREVPLNTNFYVTVSPAELSIFSSYPEDVFGILPLDRDLAPASNVQENRLSAPVQSAEQETQENRESASGQQDASRGAQPWPEQNPSQYQLKRRQRREQRGRREQQGQPRPRGAQQQGRGHFARRDYRRAMVEDAQAYARNVQNAYENFLEADRVFEQVVRGNRGRGNEGGGNRRRGNRGMGAYQA